MGEQIKDLSSKLDGKISDFKTLVSGKEKVSQIQIAQVSSDIQSLRDQLSKLIDEKNGEVKSIKDSLTELITFGDRLDKVIKTTRKDVEEIRRHGGRKRARLQSLGQ